MGKADPGRGEVPPRHFRQGFKRAGAFVSCLAFFEGIGITSGEGERDGKHVFGGTNVSHGTWMEKAWLQLWVESEMERGKVVLQLGNSEIRVATRGYGRREREKEG